MIARRTKSDVVPQTRLLFGKRCVKCLGTQTDGRSLGSTDGSLISLTPVDENAFKRFQLLQGQLTRNIQHVAGLNPKAFRFVFCSYSLDGLRKLSQDRQERLRVKTVVEGHSGWKSALVV
jgi:hypothetical protein